MLLSFFLGVAWVPVVEQFEYSWSYLVRIGAFLLMPYTAVFLFGILWKRTNTAGAWAAVIVGLTLAPILTIDSELHFLPVLKDHAVLRPYLNSSLVSLVACVIALVVTMLLTDPPPKEKLENTTFSLDQLRAVERGEMESQHIPLYKDYRPWFVAALILATTLIFITR